MADAVSYEESGDDHSRRDAAAGVPVDSDDERPQPTERQRAAAALPDPPFEFMTKALDDLTSGGCDAFMKLAPVTARRRPYPTSKAPHGASISSHADRHSCRWLHFHRYATHAASQDSGIVGELETQDRRVGKGAQRRAHLERPKVGTRSLSSGRPTGSGLWPARWQTPAGPVGFAHPTRVRK